MSRSKPMKDQEQDMRWNQLPLIHPYIYICTLFTKMIASTLCSTLLGSAFHARQTLNWPRIWPVTVHKEEQVPTAQMCHQQVIILVCGVTTINVFCPWKVMSGYLVWWGFVCLCYSPPYHIIQVCKDFFIGRPPRMISWWWAGPPACTWPTPPSRAPPLATLQLAADETYQNGYFRQPAGLVWHN